MAKKAPSTIRLKPNEADELKDTAWKLSLEANEMFRESELVHILIEQGLKRIKIINGKPTLT